MKTPQIIIVAVLLAILSLVNAITVKRENSLAPPFIAGGENLIFWDPVGSTQLGGSFIRLTTDEPQKQGGIWNNFPLISNNWEIQTHFNIHGKGVNLNGDGMAIWYVRDALHTGPVFGSRDYFSGLGIFIDTFENQKDPQMHPHPYISAMVNNGSLHYEHNEDGTMTQVGGCHAPLRNRDVPTKIAVSYIRNLLSVYLDYEGTNQWKVCFKAQEVYLPTGYFVGATASTSDLSDNHDLISVTTLNLDSTDKEWIDRSDVIPEAKNVQIPLKYHKDFIEAEEKKKQKIEQKRGIKPVEEEDEEDEEEDEDDNNEDEETEDAKTATKDPILPSTSLLTKLIYITGAAIILFVTISMYRKYSERRRERMQKRLY